MDAVRGADLIQRHKAGLDLNHLRRVEGCMVEHWNVSCPAPDGN